MKTPVSDIAEQRLLLACAQAGDERAFRRLVEPYRHALEVHCYRMLGSAQDAEDMAQETLLRAWRALERFEPRAQFQTWLYRIATNACLDELERRPRRPAPVEQRLPGTTRPAADPAERELLHRYVAAFEQADMDGLVALLREDATLRMPPQSVSGGLRIARFFLESVARGDLRRIRHRPTWANGRPAVTIEVRGKDGTWIPHGISLLEIEEGQIAGIDAFLDPTLLPRFG